MLSLDIFSCSDRVVITLFESCRQLLTKCVWSRRMVTARVFQIVEPLAQPNLVALPCVPEGRSTPTANRPCTQGMGTKLSKVVVMCVCVVHLCVGARFHRRGQSRLVSRVTMHVYPPKPTVTVWNLVAVLPRRDAAAQSLALFPVGVRLFGVDAKGITQLRSLGSRNEV